MKPSSKSTLIYTKFFFTAHSNMGTLKSGFVKFGHPWYLDMSDKESL